MLYKVVLSSNTFQFVKLLIKTTIFSTFRVLGLKGLGGDVHKDSSNQLLSVLL